MKLLQKKSKFSRNFVGEFGKPILLALKQVANTSGEVTISQEAIRRLVTQNTSGSASSYVSQTTIQLEEFGLITREMSPVGTHYKLHMEDIQAFLNSEVNYCISYNTESRTLDNIVSKTVLCPETLIKICKAINTYGIDKINNIELIKYVDSQTRVLVSFEGKASF